jgi:bacterioferritin
VTPSNQAELSKLAQLTNTLLAGLVVSSLQFEQHAHLVRGASVRPLADFLRGCADADRAARSVAERVHQLGFRSDFDPRHLVARSPVPFQTFADDSLTAVVTQSLIGVRIWVSRSISLGMA